MSRSRFLRSIQIMRAFGSYGWYWMRWRHKSPERLPPMLRQTLENLGTTFIKMGQGLSLRRDLLPAAYLEALESLQSTVPPFDSEIAVRTIESAFGQSVDELFVSFERIPFAAASIAQVHRAEMPDGRPVVVKVRRPAIVREVAADLWLLRRLLRLGIFVFPRLKAQQPLDLVDELEEFLRSEMDLVREASNMRRLAKVFDELPNATMPGVIEPLVHAEVLVQDFSSGQPLRTVFATESALKLAEVVLDVYVQQLFVKGVFHADPHPGNLFTMGDGRVCFHDFGSVGYLDPDSRVYLAQLIEAIVINDAASVLDAATGMGFIMKEADRHAYQRAISEILERMASLPLQDWSVAEAIWQIARIGSGKKFRLPRHLLVLLRTLFLAENTLRALVPNFDLIQALRDRSSEIQRLIESNSTQPSLTERVANATQQMPALLADVLRQLRLDEGRLSLGIHHHGLEELKATISRTGNRLALTLITLGFYLAGAVMMLHEGGPRLWGHVPLEAALAFGLAVLLSLRLISAIRHSGKL